MLVEDAYLVNQPTDVPLLHPYRNLNVGALRVPAQARAKRTEEPSCRNRGSCEPAWKKQKGAALISAPLRWIRLAVNKYTMLNRLNGATASRGAKRLRAERSRHRPMKTGRNTRPLWATPSIRTSGLCATLIKGWGVHLLVLLGISYNTLTPRGVQIDPQLCNQSRSVWSPMSEYRMARIWPNWRFYPGGGISVSDRHF